MPKPASFNRGFSLIELLIVVGIILVIATIAIPSLLRSRQRANESSAVANLRTVSNAQATYVVSSGGIYGSLTALVSSGVLDNRFATGVLGGYTYSVDARPYAYSAVATPTSSSTGRYGFYVLADGVVRYATTTSLAPPGQAGVPVTQ